MRGWWPGDALPVTHTFLVGQQQLQDSPSSPAAPALCLNSTGKANFPLHQGSSVRLGGACRVPLGWPWVRMGMCGRAPVGMGAGRAAPLRPKGFLGP